MKRSVLALSILIGALGGADQPVVKKIKPARPGAPVKKPPAGGQREAKRRVGGQQWEREKRIDRKKRGLS